MYDRGQHRGLGAVYDTIDMGGVAPTDPYSGSSVDNYGNDPILDPYTYTPPPESIPLAYTPSGGLGPFVEPPPLVNWTQPVSPIPSTAYTPTTSAMFKNPDGSPTYDGTPYSPTDLLNPYNFSHLFGAIGDVFGSRPLPIGVSRPALYAPAGTTTPAMTAGLNVKTLAVLGIGAALLFAVLNKRPSHA